MGVESRVVILIPSVAPGGGCSGRSEEIPDSRRITTVRWPIGDPQILGMNILHSYTGRSYWNKYCECVGAGMACRRNTARVTGDTWSCRKSCGFVGCLGGNGAATSHGRVPSSSRGRDCGKVSWLLGSR
jgi:hypothetical protein